MSEWISGCCINLFISFTDHVISGNGIWFFIMSIWSEMVASQSAIRWHSDSLAWRHSPQVGSISGLSLDWKYAKLLYPVIVLIHVLSMYVPIFSMYFYLVRHRIALCVYTMELISIAASICVLYILNLFLATCQVIGILAGFICVPPAAPSLAAWSACSFPSVPTWDFIQLSVWRLRPVTPCISVP